jgi:hypothetical protein
MVHKIDRLSRLLADFHTLTKRFEAAYVNEVGAT